RPRQGVGMDKLVRDGIGLAYEISGSGEPPLVFVHGWCCDHTYFAPQVERFRRDHRVLAVDLRGHGASDQPVQDYTAEVFADDVAWLCERLDVGRPVVIGHSMGGIVALALAVRHPALPRAIAALDSPLPPLAGGTAAREALLASLAGPGYQASARRYCDDNFFLPTDDPVRRARILDAMTAAPQHVMVSAMAAIAHYDSAPALQALAVPLLYVAANEEKPRADVARLRTLCRTLTYGQTVGSGHFLQLEVPDQVNAMLARFLYLIPHSA